MRKLLLLTSFFLFTPCVLLASIILLSYHLYSLDKQNQFILLPSNISTATVAYAALPSVESQFSGSVGSSDARVEKLQTFFQEYGSVLQQYAQDIVSAADTYDIDWRLLSAISMQESQGCKKEIPGTMNCFGWGITAKQTTKFDSYSQAIDTISKGLANNYIEKGYNTPEEIGKLYNPGNTHDWSDKIIYFIQQIQSTP